MIIQNEANTFFYIKELTKNAMFYLNGPKKDKRSADVCLDRLYKFAEMCEKKHNGEEN